MKQFISIDIETTGLSFEKGNRIVEVAGSVHRFDKELYWQEHNFSCIVNPGECTWSKIALDIHTESGLYDQIYTDGASVEEAVNIFQSFLRKEFVSEPIVIAGKNFGMFDFGFLKPLGFFEGLRFSRRVLDPGMLFFNPLTDKFTPSLQECAERAGLEQRPLHVALDDAIQVGLVLESWSNLSLS
jgi:oligoribonuclease (3'-5' exoribonuclease)